MLRNVTDELRSDSAFRTFLLEKDSHSSGVTELAGTLTAFGA